MTMKLKHIFISSFLLAGGLVYFFNQQTKHSVSIQEKELPIIVITQIIEHHTLDTVREGLMAELKEQGFGKESTNIIYENAHGNVATATQIGNKFASLHPKIMIALSTQSAQILLPIATNGQIPLVFTAVTNPVAAKLVPSKTVPGKFTTGVSDFMSPEPQLEMMRAFIPKLTKLGVLHNPAEINSVSFLKEMENVAKSQGIEFVYAAVNSTSEATSATTSLIGKVDAIYFPNDNTAMAAVGAIATEALKHKIPVFANDSASVERGVLAAVAYDRFAMGRKTGEIVVAILRGQKPQDIPVLYDTPSEVVVNEKTLKSLNLKLPEALKTIRKI